MEIQHRARTLYSELDFEDTEPLNERVREAYNEEISCLPPFVQAALEQPSGRRTFLVHNNPNVIEKCQKDRKTKNFGFIPAIPICALSNQNVQKRAEAICRRLRPEHLTEIDRQVEDAYPGERASLLNWIPTSMERFLRESWMISRYVASVENHVSKDRSNFTWANTASDSICIHAVTPSPSRERGLAP